MLDIRKLLMLRAIDSEGSIAAAARSLKYTRSAVSQQISALERETRARLVERTAGRVTLTAVGHQLVEHTERILVELRAAEAMLDSDPEAVGGLLRVGVGGVVGVRERDPRCHQGARAQRAGGGACARRGRAAEEGEGQGA